MDAANFMNVEPLLDNVLKKVLSIMEGFPKHAANDKDATFAARSADAVISMYAKC